jgi:hypothetical protein
MKISIDKVSITPPNMPFNFCVYGEPEDEVLAWVDFWNLKLEASGPFTNIIVPEYFEIQQLFEPTKQYDYVDGFSPNLNKNLHIGHLSNLVIAKSLQSLGVGESFIAILGDTLEGTVTKEDALSALYDYCNGFGYEIEYTFMASEVKFHTPLVKGLKKYAGTEGFLVGDKYIVGIKSDGSTSYFYQDAALAQYLNAPTLYLTGLEQEDHFTSLQKLFPNVSHLPLGLVTAEGKKVSSREGNVIYAYEVLDLLMEEFGNIQLAYNVFAGIILSSTPRSMKKIDLDKIANVKASPGLYLSYTSARLKSAGITPKITTGFNSHRVTYAYLKALNNKNPKILLTELKILCKKINVNYGKYRIEGNPENVAIFSPQADDLETGMLKLGMFSVDKV